MENTVTHRTSVFIVEDSPAIRMRLVAMLEAVPGVAVVGEAETPKSAVEGILRTNPDAVVLDIQLTGGSGIEVLRKVKPLRPGTVFFVLTNNPDVRYRKLYLEAGARYFLDKTAEFEKMRELVAGLGSAH